MQQVGETTWHVSEEWSRLLTAAARPTEPVAAACTAWDAAAADDVRASEPAKWDGPYQPPADHCRRCPLRSALLQETHRHGCHCCRCRELCRWRWRPLRPALPALCPAAPGPWLLAWLGLLLGAAGSAHCPGPGRLPRMNWPGRLVLLLLWPPGVRSASWLRPHRPAGRLGSCLAARQTARAAARRRVPADSFRPAALPATLLVRRAPRGRTPSRLRPLPPDR